MGRLSDKNSKKPEMKPVRVPGDEEPGQALSKLQERAFMVIDKMDMEERVEFFEALEESYCVACGDEQHNEDDENDVCPFGDDDEDDGGVPELPKGE